MNFLQAVNRAKRECTDKGGDLTTLQGSLTLENQRFKDWVNETWMELQTDNPQWDWMRASFQFDTVAGQQGYTLSQANAADAADWRRSSFRAWTKAVGSSDEQILPFMEYDTWRNVYTFGSMRTTQARPVAMTVKPDRTLAIGPVPDAVYTVVGEYWRAPAEMATDTDTPTGLADRFHMLLVYGAMEKFSHHEAAPEVYTRASTARKRLKNQLFASGLPILASGPPLA